MRGIPLRRDGAVPPMNRDTDKAAEGTMTTDTGSVRSARRMRLTRRSPHYWRVTFDHPPLNIFGPETIPQLDEVITALETDEQVKVVVMDSSVDGFFPE